MPGLDGLSAAREIAGERRAAVLILTAFSQRDLIEQARDAGALAYLVKPFQRSELIPAIEVALGRFQRDEGAARPGRRASRSSSRPARSSTGPRAGSWTSTACRSATRSRFIQKTAMQRAADDASASPSDVLAGDLASTTDPPSSRGPPAAARTDADAAC